MVRNPLGEAPALRSSVMFTGRHEGELVDAHANSQLGAYLRGSAPSELWLVRRRG